MTIIPMSDALHRPILCPSGPNRLVPIKYEIEAGRKATPSSHFLAHMLPIMKMGNDGSNMPMPMLAKVMAPA